MLADMKKARMEMEKDKTEITPEALEELSNNREEGEEDE